MKIVIATPLYTPEIVEPAPYVKKISELLRQKYKITIVAYTNNQDNIQGTKLLAVKKNQPTVFRLLKYTLSLLRATYGAQAIYVPNGIASSLPATIISFLTRTPLIIKVTNDEAWERATQLGLTNQNLDEFLDNPKTNTKIQIIISLQGFILRRARVITASSLYLKNIIINKYKISKDKIVVNYNPTHTKEILPFPAKTIPFQIVAPAEFATQDDIKKIIRSVAVLKERYKDIKLVIIGKIVNEKELKSFAQKLNIDKYVDFLGDVSQAEKWYSIKTSAVQIINRENKTHPDIVLDGFITNTPTIATNVEGINEAIIDNQSGILIEPNNEQQLINAITNIFQQSIIANNIIAGAEKLANKRFSWDKHLSILNDIFKKFNK